MAGDLVISTINGQAIGTKNIIIDGNFNVNQRGVSGTVTLAAGAYGHDRWKGGASGCTYTFATVENVTTLTISAGSLIQVVEGLNLQSGTYTLSFSGTAQGKINGGSFSASGVTGTATGGTNMTIEFNTGTLSLVQLEKGSTATAFDYRPYGTELALCQRYYYKLQATANNQDFGAACAVTTTVGRVSMPFPVTMRSPPSAVEQSGTASNYQCRFANTNTSCSAVPTFSTASVAGSAVNFTVALGLIAGQGGQFGAGPSTGASAFLAWSAEL
jgi:hypothetical protein